MSGGQIMVVAIVAMVMLAGIIKASIMAKHGYETDKCGRRRKPKGDAAGTAQRDDALAELNARLDKVIDRLSVLEKIVTDEDRDLRRKFADLEGRDNRPSA